MIVKEQKTERRENTHTKEKNNEKGDVSRSEI
jgi:hypothetical protein